ncbi:hypothetical protein JX266_009778 [Neoarthrinium moseri]|nr:hypothetical protein JX266_009778 [Neoarthrinium moseri]
MRATITTVLASIATLAAGAQNERTFAVLRFDGDGFMTEGRVDPIINPGTAASHFHGIMGGNAFGTTVVGDQLLSSTCTNAKIKNDKSNYWAPQVYFQDPKNGTFTKVPLFYMNVYYFFEPTDDEIKSFPPGLKMVVGDAKTRDPPAFGGGSNLNPDSGPIQPVQFTCPRTSYNPPSYPADSDGSMAGMQDPHNQGAGAGFPLYPCDTSGAPLRADIHFPSCYNPEVGLEDYKNNMAWPTVTNGKQNCPSGHIHVPHIFFELYWNTPKFDHLWTPDGKNQPFVLANGDRTGFSSHADFISGWDETTLKTIIDTCNVGSIGMQTCPDIPGGLNTDMNCKIDSPIVETLSLEGPLLALPGNNPVSGWGVNGDSSGSGSSDDAGSYPASGTVQQSTAKATSAGSQATSNTAISDAQTSSPAEVSVGHSVGLGGQKGKAPSTSELPEAVGNYATTGTVVAADQPSIPAAANGPAVSTVWDIVTVTQTQTVYAEASAHVKRQNHGHLARHRRSGHLGRS